jgi:hypothetical protein
LLSLNCTFDSLPALLKTIIFVFGSNNSYKPIPNTEWVRARLCKLQKGCTRLAAYIAEILLKVALKQQKIKSKADYINNHILNV